MNKIYSSEADLNNIENDSVSLSILFAGKKAAAIVYQTISGKIHEIISEGNDHLEIRGTQLNRFLTAIQNFSNYENVKVGFNNNYTIVPNKYFEKEDISEYLDEILGGNSKAHVFDNLSNVEAKIAYKQDEKIVNQIRSVFPSAKFSNINSAFIDYTIKNKPGNSFCLLSKISDELDVIILKDNKLQIVNRYDGSSKENILYYTLSVLESIDFDPKNTYIYLTGNLSTEEQNGKLLKKYGLRIIDFPIKNLDQNIKNPHNYYKLLSML